MAEIKDSADTVTKVRAATGSPWITGIGGLLGYLSSLDGGEQKQTTDKDPWAAAAPYLKQNLNINQQLQNHYLQNPFSNEQKAAYQNQANVLANNQANVPNFNQIASNFMGSNRGKMAAMPGLLSGTQAAPIDFKAMNPFQSGLLGDPNKMGLDAPVDPNAPAVKTKIDQFKEGAGDEATKIKEFWAKAGADLRGPGDEFVNAGKNILPGAGNLNPIIAGDKITNKIASIFGW